jgi:ABC-type uncharacterized transport system substrate-binding protein
VGGVTTRRTFIAALAGGLLAAPRAADAQQEGKVYRLGILSATVPPAPSDRGVASLLVLAILREMGYVEGQNLVVERRYAENQFDRLPSLARQLVELRMDVIFAVGNDAPGAVRAVSKSIPIVMIGRDPVTFGYVASLARPGGEPGRASHAAANRLRADDQSEDGQSPRSHDPPVRSAPGRSGDRVTEAGAGPSCVR